MLLGGRLEIFVKGAQQVVYIVCEDMLLEVEGVLVVADILLPLWGEFHLQLDCLQEDSHCLKYAIQLWHCELGQTLIIFGCGFMLMSYFVPVDGHGMGLALTVRVVV